MSAKYNQKDSGQIRFVLFTVEPKLLAVLFV